MTVALTGAWARVGLSGDRAVLLCAIVLTLWRSLAPIIDQRLNSDEALVALMGKHLADGRAFPLFLYGLPYIAGIEAWLAAPFFLAGGATVPMLRMPLLLENIAIAFLLVACLRRDAGLGRGFALTAALPVVLAPPLVSHLHLMDAGGTHPEPLLFIALLWILRHRPLLFGSVLALGMLNRPFVFYGAAALVVVQWRQGSLLRREIWKFWAIAAIAALAVFDLFSSLRVWSSPLGPGTYYEPTIPSTAAANVAFACFDARTIPRGIWNFASDVLPLMLGGTGRDARLPYVAGATMVLAAGRMFRISSTLGNQASRRNDYLVYLLVAGVLSAFVYVVARCGAVNAGHHAVWARHAVCVGGRPGVAFQHGTFTARAAPARGDCVRLGAVAVRRPRPDLRSSSARGPLEPAADACVLSGEARRPLRVGRLLGRTGDYVPHPRARHRRVRDHLAHHELRDRSPAPRTRGHDDSSPAVPDERTGGRARHLLGVFCNRATVTADGERRPHPPLVARREPRESS